MAYWVEIHCDTPQRMGPLGADRAKHCDRETGAIPGVSTKNLRKSLDAAMALARERGYRYDRLYGWQCPNCQKGRRYI